jgi:peptidoglycan/LPS O-acetylase OafA/YrhL
VDRDFIPWDRLKTWIHPQVVLGVRPLWYRNRATMLRELVAFPFATISSIFWYMIAAALIIPKSRDRLAPYLGHPVTPNQQYQPGFDTLRGLAAALVAIGHCWWTTYPLFGQTNWAFLSHAAKAVPIFAALSGFLIYRSVINIRCLEDLRGYIFRRFFRIYPVYALGIALCVAFGNHYLPAHDYGSLGYFLSDVFMFHIIEWPGPYSNAPNWSLYIECLFYVLLPLAVLSVRRERVVICAIILMVALIVADSESRLFGLWKFFVAGVIAAELSPRIIRSSVPLFAAGTGLLIWDFGGPNHDWFSSITGFHRDYSGESTGLMFACGLILASLPHIPSVGRMLNVLPLRVLGSISYSVYIIQFFYILANIPELQRFSNAGTPPMTAHFQAMAQMSWWYLPFVFFPGVFFWGLVSFLLVERPGMQFGRWLLTRSSPGESLSPVESLR